MDEEFEDLEVISQNYIDEEEIDDEPELPDLNTIRILAREREEKLEEVFVNSIEFSMFSPKQISEIAVVNFDQAYIRSNPKAKKTIPDDPRLGAKLDSNCGLCGSNYVDCIGHFGSLELPDNKVVINPLCIQTVVNVLNCICIHCSRLPFDVNDSNDTRNHPKELNKRINYINSTYAKVQICPHCSNELQRFKINKFPDKTDSTFLKNKANNTFLDPNTIYECFLKLSKDEYEYMGFKDNPINMLIKKLLITPYNTRPSVMDKDREFENKWTSIYESIIDKIGKYGLEHSTLTQKEQLEEIYREIRNLYIGKDSNSSKNKIIGIAPSIQGKEGSIRGEIMGKRVNYVGRTVASPGGELMVNEIGIPEAMANILTIPEKVTEYNRSMLQNTIENMRATMITRKNSDIKKRITERNKSTIQLSIGDTVVRKIQNGDIAIVNRQPTLNKQNFIALLIRIVPGKTILINLSNTAPLAGDFDGDELNIHIPQTSDAQVEAAELLSNAANLIDTTNLGAIMPIVYNSLAGVYLLTNDGNNSESRRLYREDPNNISYQQRIGLLPDNVFRDIVNYTLRLARDANPQETIRKVRQRVEREGQIWNTKAALLSFCLPPNFIYYKKDIAIRNGVVLNGVITAAYIGKKQNSILTEMYNKQNVTNENIDEGGFTNDNKRNTIYFMSLIQFIANRYLAYRSLSINYWNCVPKDKNFRAKLNTRVNTMSNKIATLIDGHEDLMDANDMNVSEVDREELTRRLQVAMNEVNIIGANFVRENFDSDNPLIILATSGAKGSENNIRNIASSIGLQKIDGTLIKRSLDGNRILSINEPYNFRAENLGFVVNSYLTGLNPREYFYHQIAMRESLLDIANGVSNVGSLNRDINKSLENVYSSPDGSILNNKIIEFVSGADAFRPNAMTATIINDKSEPFFMDITQLANELNVKYNR